MYVCKCRHVHTHHVLGGRGEFYGGFRAVGLGFRFCVLRTTMEKEFQARHKDFGTAGSSAPQKPNAECQWPMVRAAVLGNQH